MRFQRPFARAYLMRVSMQAPHAPDPPYAAQARHVRASGKEDGFLFQPLTREMLPAIYARQQKLHTLSSEFDAFRLFVWKELDLSEVAFWRDTFALRCQAQGETWYLAPPETDALPELLAAMEAYERAQGGTVFRFLHIGTPDSFPGEGFTAEPRRDLYDYIYRAEDLATMHGRAYGAKRNQIAQFKRNYDWRFEPLTPENRDDCLRLVAIWDATHQGAMLAQERKAVERMLQCTQSLGQSGGVLYADGQPAAFAIGSHPRAELLDILAEKALPQYTGAYSAIIQAYAAYTLEHTPFTYINREEDMGLENLRNAKLQLKPDHLVEKTLMSKPL